MNGHAPALASLELPHRIERAFRSLAYIVLTVPRGVLGLLALVGVGLSALLSLLGIGFPLLSLAIAACRRLAEIDRRAANASPTSASRPSTPSGTQKAM